jgi:regulatory protein
MENKITALTVQKKNPQRVNVYLDGNFAFGLARITAVWLKVGQVLDDKKIAELKRQDSEEVAYQRALKILGTRSRSSNEISDKLLKAGFEESVSEAVIQRLDRNGLISDQSFAQEWVDNRMTFRPRSHRMLAMELHQKGVSDENIQDALADAESDEVLAYKAASQRMRRLKDLPWDDFRRKMLSFLQRRGFSYGAASSAVQQVWEELHELEGPS